jgi:hypothetical protein
VRYWQQGAHIPMDRFSVPFAVKKIGADLRREGVHLFVSREFRAGVELVAKRQCRTRKREQPVETAAK